MGEGQGNPELFSYRRLAKYGLAGFFLMDYIVSGRPAYGRLILFSGGLVLIVASKNSIHRMPDLELVHCALARAICEGRQC
jgi:hypothetical protein